MPEITEDIVNNGMVMVYGGFLWDENWSALPISYFETGRTVYFSYSMKSGGVTLRGHDSNNAVPVRAGIPFRVVVVKGQAAAAAKQRQIPMADYASVAAFFDLK